MTLTSCVLPGYSMVVTDVFVAAIDIHAHRLLEGWVLQFGPELHKLSGGVVHGFEVSKASSCSAHNDHFRQSG